MDSPAGGALEGAARSSLASMGGSPPAVGVLPLPADDLSCPICRETLDGVVTTPCGHSFCFVCISTHLGVKKSCPSCNNYLTEDHIHPNFLLNKILGRLVSSSGSSAKQSTLLGGLQTALQGSGKLSLEDVAHAIQLLQDKRQQLETQESQGSLQLLLLFLQRVRDHQGEHLSSLQQQLHTLKHDLTAITGQQQRQQAAAEVQALLPGGAVTGSTAGMAGASGAAAQQQQQQPAQSSAPAPAATCPAPVHAVQHDPQLLPSVGGGPSAQQEMGSLALLGAAGSAFRPGSGVRAVGLLGGTRLGGGGSGGSGSGSGSGSGGSGFRPYSQAPPAGDVVAAASGRGGPAGAGPGSLASDHAAGGGSSGAAATAAGAGTAEAEPLPGLVVADLSPAAKRRRIVAHMGELEEAYLRLRGAHMAQMQDRRSSGTGGLGSGGASVEGGATAGPEAGTPAGTHGTTAGAGGLEAGAPDGGLGAAAALLAASGGAEGSGGAAAAAAAAGPVGGLEDGRALTAFSRILTATTQYSRLQLVAKLPTPPERGGSGAARPGAACNILSSIAVDASSSSFATAGVQQRICLYSFAAVCGAASPEASAGGSARAPAQAAMPALDLATRHKVSSLAFCPSGAPQHLMAADYAGQVALWDVQQGALVREWAGHGRRIWSVEYAPTDGTRFATGSDDGTVKVWSESAAAPQQTLTVRANVCSVQFSPASPHLLAVGTAGHAVLLYDLRRAGEPLRTLLGHSKAVAYVRWLGDTQLVSASTDNSLRLWEVGADGLAGGGACVRAFRGHSNERNFIGLSCEGPFIACGSETHEVFVYHRDMPRPCMRFSWPQPAAPALPAAGQQPDQAAAQGGAVGAGAVAQGGAAGAGAAGAAAAAAGPSFVSAVCWRRHSNMLVAADSQGSVAVLALRA